jgi:hypothetical protein
VSILYINPIVVPRQARDKHRKKALRKKVWRFSYLSSQPT